MNGKVGELFQKPRDRGRNAWYAAPILHKISFSFYKLASTGEIPAFRIGNSWRFNVQEVEKMIEDAKMRNLMAGEKGSPAK